MNKIKGLLCDLDNTLYDYEQTHQKAMKAALSFFCEHTKLGAKDGETLVFVEVKSRYNLEFGPPELGITKNKQRQVRRIAEAYSRGEIAVNAITELNDNFRKLYCLIAGKIS